MINQYFRCNVDLTLMYAIHSSAYHYNFTLISLYVLCAELFLNNLTPEVFIERLYYSGY